MTYTTSSRWDSSSIGSAAHVLEYARRNGAARLDFLADMLEELYRLAPLVNLNADLAASHSAHECGHPQTGAPWQSPIWRARGNPSGLGVTDGPDHGIGFSSGADAARAHLVHLHAYVHGAIPRDSPLYPCIHLDVRYGLVLGGNYAGEVKTVAQMTGRWWTDRDGHVKVAARARTIFDGLPDQEEPMPDITFGRVPRPNIRDDIVNKPEGNGWGDYGPRILRAVVLHRVVGAARFTSGHFRNLNDPHGRNALTDWGICGALDGDMDGVILKWNDPDSRRSPWASGPASGLNGDAIAFMQRYAASSGVGANVINRDTEAVELSGRYDTPLTPNQLEAACQLIAYRIDHKMKLPWNVWPKNHDGVQAILWHGEVNGWEKPCPGKVVIDATEYIIQRVGQILRQYQIAGVPVPPPQPEPEPEPVEKHALPKGMSEAMAKRQFNPFKITHPDTGQRIVFDRGIAPCQVWLKWGKESMETDDWRSGSWPPLVSVIREGDGDETWKWAAGPQYERKAA